MKNAFKKFGSFLAIVVFLVIAIGTQEVDEPNSIVTKLEITPDSKVINGKLLNGYTVSCILINGGAQGTIEVTAKLYCSEGEWTREETHTLDTEETIELEYFFQEPTIYCENVKGKIETEPYGENKFTAE